jgi:hypothetical protein
MKVVLYAEGAGETAGIVSFQRAPGVPLSDEELGSGHLLVRRTIASRKHAPEAAVAFFEPLRTRGRVPKGSDLCNKTTLQQLLTWPRAEERPVLVVVLVDCDEHPERKAVLQGFLSDKPVPHVVAMAIQEFEAWLLADHKAVVKVLGSVIAQQPAPESLPCRKAKELIKEWASAVGRSAHESEIRRDLAAQCDIATVASACPAFAGFLSDIDTVKVR